MPSNNRFVLAPTAAAPEPYDAPLTTHGIRAGLRCGRDERSAIPATPRDLGRRPDQRAAVVTETWNRSAAPP